MASGHPTRNPPLNLRKKAFTLGQSSSIGMRTESWLSCTATLHPAESTTESLCLLVLSAAQNQQPCSRRWSRHIAWSYPIRIAAALTQKHEMIGFESRDRAGPRFPFLCDIGDVPVHWRGAFPSCGDIPAFLKIFRLYRYLP